MGKRIAIVQSSYIPWKGYLDLIASVDEFVLFDDVQYTRRDWRNRNRIKTAGGASWLTIPVEVKGRYLQLIKDTVVSDPNWARDHWRTLQHAYARAPFFRDYGEPFARVYLGPPRRFLSDVNRAFLECACGLLGIRTPLRWSMDYPAEGTKSDRLLSICRQAGATEYLSGPSARSYLDEELFARAGVRVLWMDYAGYPEYPQQHPPFDHHVSIVDLLFHEGPRSPRYLKGTGHAPLDRGDDVSVRPLSA